MVSTAIEEQLIEAKIAEVKESGNHGFSVFRTGDSEVDGALEGGKMGLTTTAADKVIIYDTETNEPREILVNMLSKTLRKRRAGKPAFSLEPKGEYRRGTHLCYLHPEHPERELLRELGINKLCGEGTTQPAGNLASALDVRTHMEHRHKREWLTLQEHYESEEKKYDRERQDRLANAMLAAVQNRSESVPEDASAPVVHLCGVGGCQRFFDSEQGARMHRTKEHSG